MIDRLRHASQSLTFKIAALLAVALLPIGVLSVAQTYVLIEETREREEASLLALTVEAADREAAYIRSAFGAAQAVAALHEVILSDTEQCEIALQTFLAASSVFSFIGYVDETGTVRCASGGSGRDVSDNTVYLAMLEKAEPRVDLVAAAPISGTSVVAVSVPVVVNDVFQGFASVSMYHSRLFTPRSTFDPQRPVDLVTFNAVGEILTGVEVEESEGDGSDVLPANAALKSLARIGKTTFIGTNNMGDRRVFASVPIIDGSVYALGSWPYRDENFTSQVQEVSSSILFPAAMWFAGLVVAFVAVQQLVIKPTRNLRARMLMFVRTRRIQGPTNPKAIPREIAEIDETWQRMAESILHDEAELHNSLHEKNVLLKEVHHRVKNNLQLISSIINMKMRKARTPEQRQALSEVQGRVMSIARVHQKLYETSTEERVRADELLGALIQQIVGSMVPDRKRLKLTQDLDPVILYPDQAVPISLAVSELVTNALKYMGNKGMSKGAELRVTLKATGQGEAVIEVFNTVDPNAEPDPELRGSGLGQKLVHAFASQVEGDCATESDGTTHCVQITFPVADFVAE